MLSYTTLKKVTQILHLLHRLLHQESRQPSIQVDRIVERPHAPGLEKVIKYIVLLLFQQNFGPVIQEEVVDIGVARLCGSDIVQVA